MTAPTFPCFIKKTQINPEFSNFSVYQGWVDFCDQSVVCQDISKVPCFVSNTTDISVLTGIFRNSVKVPCFVNLQRSKFENNFPFVEKLPFAKGTFLSLYRPTGEVGGKKGNRTEPNQRIVPDGAYGNFRLLRYRVLPPSPDRTNESDIYCLFYHYFFSFY